MVDDTREPEEEEEGQEQAQPTAPPEEELKIVAQMKGRRAIISVGKPGHDPVVHLYTIDGEGDPVYGVAALVHQAVREAREKWAVSPRNPAAAAPPPPSQPARTAAPAKAAAKAPVKATAKKQEEAPTAIQDALPLF